MRKAAELNYKTAQVMLSGFFMSGIGVEMAPKEGLFWSCLLYTSDAADDLLCVDLGGRRIIKKKRIKDKQREQPEC